MFDFIKLRVDESYYDILKRNEHLTHIAEVNSSTGEVTNNTAYFNYNPNYKNDKIYKGNLQFAFKESGVCFITGSIHKFYNNRNYNANDFNFSNVCNAVDRFAHLFQIDPNYATMHNLEIGLNIKPPIDTFNILNGLIKHKGEKGFFKDVSLASGDYRQAIRNNYYLKAYDKAMQYNLAYQLFRFEEKVTRMKELEKYQLQTLADLTNHNKIEPLGEHLIKKWNECLYFDNTIDKSLLNSSEIIKLKDWSNQNYWSNLINHAKFKDKNKTSREYAKLKQLTDRTSEGIQKQIEELLRAKWGELTIQL